MTLAQAAGNRLGCPHRVLEVPWWEGCDGTPEACMVCWNRPAADKP